MSLFSKIKSACAALSPNCREAARAQSDALEQPLSLSKRIGLRLHLLLCKWCRRYGQQIRFLRETAQQHQEELTTAAPQKLSAEARKRIKKSLQEKD